MILRVFKHSHTLKKDFRPHTMPPDEDAGQRSPPLPQFLSIPPPSVTPSLPTGAARRHGDPNTLIPKLPIRTSTVFSVHFIFHAAFAQRSRQYRNNFLVGSLGFRRNQLAMSARFLLFHVFFSSTNLNYV